MGTHDDSRHPSESELSELSTEEILARLRASASKPTEPGKQSLGEYLDDAIEEEELRRDDQDGD